MIYDKKTFALVVIVVILLIWIVYPSLTKSCTEGFNNTQKPLEFKQTSYDINPDLLDYFQPSNIFPAGGFIDGGDSKKIALKFNKCSKSCCTPQYPTGIQGLGDSITCNSKEKLVGSSYTCNNSSQSAGCLCLTEDESKFLGTRGGNA